MTISKDDLLKRKEEIVTGYNELVAEIEKDGDPMPEEKAFALDMATS